MDEQQTTTGTEGTTEVVEPAQAADKPEPRKCFECGALSGNGAGQIVEGAVVFDEKTNRYGPAWFCKGCGHKSKRPLLAAEALLAMVDQLNAERDAQLAAAKAAHEADAQKFEATKGYWRDLAAGKVKARFVARADEEGNPLCGLSDCHYCVGKEPAEMFVVVKTAEGWQAIGVCIHQGAARRESKAPWVRVPWGNREVCEKEAKRRADHDAAFIADVGYFQDLWYAEVKRHGEPEQGIKVERPKPVLDEQGRLLCGVPGCSEKRPVEDGLLSERHLDVAGLCRRHRAAVAFANRRGTDFFPAPIEECDQRLEKARERIRSAAWVRREERPARPEKPATTPASEAAKARNAALAKAIREGKGLEEAGVVKPKGDPIEEAAARGDSMAAAIKAHNDAQDAQDVARRAQRKGGKKGDGKGGQKGGR